MKQETNYKEGIQKKNPLSLCATPRVTQGEDARVVKLQNYDLGELGSLLGSATEFLCKLG